MLTGNATRAVDDASPLADPLPALLMGVLLKGKSPRRPENIGGKLENTLGVVRERTGVVRDSVLVVIETDVHTEMP